MTKTNMQRRTCQRKRAVPRGSLRWDRIILVAALPAFLVAVICSRLFARGVDIPPAALFEDTPQSAIFGIDERSFSDRIGSEVYSDNVLLIDIDNKKIIAEKNSANRVYPASLTKIMTVLVALEEIEDKNGHFVLTREQKDYLIKENAAVVGFAVGESMSVDDMLYGTMLASGADAALGLANYACGSVEAFVLKMNEKAAEIGMKNTHFANVTGLHDDGHYTTPTDLARLLIYALENEDFYRIFCTQEYQSSKTQTHPEGITVKATWSESFKKENEPTSHILGGKTGFTFEAEQCLATLAEKDGARYILITLGAGEGSRERMHHVLDAVRIYDRFVW